jgi:hypothetical protein
MRSSVISLIVSKDDLTTGLEATDAGSGSAIEMIVLFVSKASARWMFLLYDCHLQSSLVYLLFPVHFFFIHYSVKAQVDYSGIDR